MKELYDKVIEAYKSGNENAFAAAARNWCEAGGSNPFKPNTKESNLYFDACRAYRLWTSKSINARVSKRRMIDYVKQIAELDLPNPYPEKKKRVVKEEPEHVLGVLPTEEKKHFFNKRKEGENK